MKDQTNKHDNGLSADSRDQHITPEGIRAQLDQVISSPDFKASKKVETIFRYLTEETLAGREDQVNAHSIADKVPNRPFDSEPPIDPLVRIQINQLRRALKGNSAGAGLTDVGPRIDMPEGRYAPVFHPAKK